MFFKSRNEERLETEVNRLKDQIFSLEREKRKLEVDNEQSAEKKKMEDERVKHLVKMKEEKLAIEHERKTVALELEKAKEVQAEKERHHKEMMEFLNKGRTELKEMYGEIIKMIPNVNVKLNGKV